MGETYIASSRTAPILESAAYGASGFQQAAKSARWAKGQVATFGNIAATQVN